MREEKGPKSDTHLSEEARYPSLAGAMFLSILLLIL